MPTSLSGVASRTVFSEQLPYLFKIKIVKKRKKQRAKVTRTENEKSKLNVSSQRAVT